MENLIHIGVREHLDENMEPVVTFQGTFFKNKLNGLGSIHRQGHSYQVGFFVDD
jgi:hypothetical protein